MHRRQCFETDDEDSKAFAAKKPGFACFECGKVLGDKQSLKRHMERKHSEQRYKCSFCEKEFKAKTDAHEHQQICQSNPDKSDPLPCQYKGCQKVFPARKYLNKHMKAEHGWTGKK